MPCSDVLLMCYSMRDFMLPQHQAQQTNVLAEEQGKQNWPPEETFPQGPPQFVFLLPLPSCALQVLCHPPMWVPHLLNAVASCITAEAQRPGATTVLWKSMGQKDSSNPRFPRVLVNASPHLFLFLFSFILPGKWNLDPSTLFTGTACPV